MADFPRLIVVNAGGCRGKKGAREFDAQPISLVVSLSSQTRGLRFIVRSELYFLGSAQSSKHCMPGTTQLPVRLSVAAPLGIARSRWGEKSMFLKEGEGAPEQGP